MHADWWIAFEASGEDKPIYGLTRGVGESKDKTVFPGGRISTEGRALSEKFNANLLRVRATATEPPARIEIVRAAAATDRRHRGHLDQCKVVIGSRPSTGRADLYVLVQGRSRDDRGSCADCQGTD